MKSPENKEIKKKCDCGPECDCGCNEGKECHCGEGCKCGCHGGCKCGCQSCGGKIIILLLVFLAGMGFNELLHGCFGRCPKHGMNPMAMMSAPHRAFDDGAGTVVIVNAGGEAMVHHKKGGKHHHGMMNNGDTMKHGGKHHHDMMKHPKFHRGMSPKPQAEVEETIEETVTAQ